MSGWDTAGAVALLLWAIATWVAAGVLALANRGPARPWVHQGCVAVIVLGVLGQIGHVQEHFAQAAYWLGHPNSPPWMTPWGDALAMGFGQVAPGRPTLGMEILHLTGNFVFLAGLAGVMVITRRAAPTKARRWARMGVWMQGLHGVEHLALTLSVALGAKQAIGLSTWFGLLQPGPGLWTYRVWWHFAANVGGSAVFVIALCHLWRVRHEVKAAYWPATRPSALSMLPAADRRAA